MDLKRLESILNAHTVDGTLILPPDALESQDIENLLDTYFMGNPLTIKIESQAEQGQTYVITGQLVKGTFPLYTESDLPAQAVFFIQAEVAELLLTLTLPAGYKLSQSFAILKDTTIDTLDIPNSSFILQSSKTNNINPDPNLRQGLNFTGDLLAVGVLQSLDWLLNSVETLYLSGLIQVEHSQDNQIIPILSVTAPVAGSISLPPFSLSFAVQLVSSYTPTRAVQFISEVRLVTYLDIGSGANPVRIPIAVPVTGGDPELLSFTLAVDEVPLIGGLSSLSSLVEGADLGALVPSQLSLGPALFLTDLTMIIANETKAIISLEMGVRLVVGWTIIPDVITLRDITLQYVVTDVMRPSLNNISAQAAAVFLIGNVGIRISVSLPEITIIGSLEEGYSINANDVLRQFFGPSVQLPEGVDLTVYELEVSAAPRSQTYSIYSVIGEDEIWTLDLVVTELVLKRLSFGIDFAPGDLALDFVAVLEIFEKTFSVSASKPGSASGWIFKIEMYPNEYISLKNLIQKFLPFSVELPESVPDMGITGIMIGYETKEKTFSIAGRTDPASWTFKIGDTSFAIEAALSIQRKPSPGAQAVYTGFVAGAIAVNDLKLGVTYAFAPGNKTLTIKMLFRGAELTCAITTKTGPPAETMLTVSLGNLNFGEIVEYLVNLASPGTDSKLGAPWDFLYDISFKNLQLEINLTTKAVGISYQLKKNFAIVFIDTIKLTYVKRNGKGTVDISITGSFLDQRYGDANPLKWDMLNDKPPAVPGQGAALLDLEYLGLGQHVAMETLNLDTVTQVIDAMERLVIPTQNPSKNPLTETRGIYFSQKSNWLIGTRFTVMGTVSLSVIFNDPNIYGLLIKLAGPKAGSLAGLEFEILYKKVTDTIGVYHIELKLPDSMRQLQFGAVSITLPVVVVDIYTNGNFRVDFGFPTNGNFARSFSLQVFPFIGFGGFYFALLSGDTSKRVPKISNGNFDPVIEFGLGLSIGVGKTIDKGVLKAGLYVTVTGILEGVIAWFNPDDKAVKSDRYYWIQGTISIVGKLYGEVDFKIISASVNVTAYASVTLVIQAYEPIYIQLSAGVSVSASVKVLFVRIHFTFKMTIQASFTIGSKGVPPWKTISAPSQSQQLQRLNVARRAYLRSARVAPALLKGAPSALRTTEIYASAADLKWDPVNVFGGQIKYVAMMLLPGFTVALPEDCGPVPPPDGSDTPQYQIVMILSAENTIAPDVRTHAEISTVAKENPEETPFNLLVHGMLAWSIYAILQTLDGFVTADDLQDLYDDLNKDETESTAFSYDNLSAFIEKNYRFQISGKTGSADEPAVSAAIVPMIPALSLDTSGNISVDFDTYNEVDNRYEQQIKAYFSKMRVNYDYGTAKDPLQQAPALQAASDKTDADGLESMAKVIFRDYFVMIAKAAVEAAIDYLAEYPYEVKDGDSLQSIADSFPKTLVYIVKPDDTLESIAAYFLVPPEVIIELNPTIDFNEPLQAGTRLTIPAIVSPEAIAVANQDVSLNAETTLDFSGIAYQVKASDTLGSIATQYGFADANGIVARNADNSAILRSGAPILIGVYDTTRQIYTISYVSQAGDNLARIAAYFYVRDQEDLAAQSSYAQAFGWLRQALIDLNPGVDFSLALAPGQELNIPRVEWSEQGIVQLPDGLTYIVKSNDTLDLITGYFLLIELYPDSLAPLEQQIKDLNPGVDWDNLPPGINITVPAIEHAIKSTDTFLILSSLFGVSLDDLATANSDSTLILAPLAVLAIPDISYKIQENDSFSKIAARYNFTVEELAAKIATKANIFVARQVITIANSPQIKIADLLSKLPLTASYNNISGIVSRFMMHGLRLLDPKDTVVRMLSLAALQDADGSDVDLCPLYVLTGQQFAGPGPDTPQYDITFKNPGEVAWVEFLPVTVYTVATSSTLTQISQQLGIPAEQIKELNPDVDFNQEVPAGTQLQVTQSQLEIELTSEILQQNYPSTKFDPQLISNPERLPLLQETPVRYTLANSIVWQSADLPPFACTTPDTPLAGQPSIWLFPETLIDLITNPDGAGSNPYKLVTGTVVTGSKMTKTDVNCYDWATVLEVGVRRIPADALGGFMPNTYMVLGADESGRDSLIALWNHLNQPGATDNATLYLLYAPNATSEIPEGLNSDKISREQTFILKTNLSTLTHSGPEATTAERALREVALREVAPQSGDYYATIAAAKDFIKFLWEASIVGTGGFYLNYSVQDGGAGLPGDIFVNGNDAILWMVVVLQSQSATEPPVRSFYGFNNCAVVKDNIDSGAVNVFVEAAQQSDPSRVPMTKSATVPPGNVGYQVSRSNPDFQPAASSGDGDPEQRTRSLYSLLGYELQDYSDFNQSNEGLPIGPTEADSEQTGGLPLPSYANTDSSIWHYHQVIPVHRYARTNNIAQCVALPAKEANPYAGIVNDQEGSLGQAKFSFSFYDLYGNYTPPTPAISDLEISVGYFDTVIGLSQWPGAANSYEFTKSGGAPALVVEIDLEVERYLPSPGNSFENAVYMSAAHVEKYKQVYYQVHQYQAPPEATAPVYDLDFLYRTSLDQPSLDGQPTEHVIAQRFSLTNYVDSAYLFLSVAQHLQAVLHVVQEGETFAKITSAYSVPVGALGEANSALDTTTIFASTLLIPTFHTVKQGDTLNSIAEGSSITVDELARENKIVLLNPGSNIEIPGRDYHVQDNDSLVSIAASQVCTVQGIARANSVRTNILVAGTLLSVQGVTVEVKNGDSFDSLVVKFREQGVEATVADIAVSNQSIENIFIAGVTISITDYIVQAGDTLANLASEFETTVEELAGLNKDAETLFLAGAPVFLFDTPGTPAPGESLAYIAEKNRITIDQLANHNATTALKEGAQLMIPYLVYIDTSKAQLFSPYEARGSEMLSDIAALFDKTPADLAEINQNLLHIFEPGKTITLDSVSVQITAFDTFDTLVKKFNDQGMEITLPEFADRIKDYPAIITAGALFAMPLPRTRGGKSLSDIAALYGVTVDGLARANGSLHLFLKENAEVIPKKGMPQTRIKVSANDTFNTLVMRFALEKQVVTTISEIAEANKDLADLVNSDELFMLPPNPVIISEQIEAHLPGTIFPVTVEIKLARHASLIDPEFKDVANVQADVTTIAPRSTVSEGSLSLEDFARQFEQQAFPGLKVATSKKQYMADDPSTSSLLWAVNFGQGGISLFEILKDEPHFFALRPLSAELVARPDVMIYSYENGQLKDPKPETFQAVDLEVWVGEFLAAVDLFLSPAYATPAYQLEADHASYEKVVKARGILADALKIAVDYILDAPLEEKNPEYLEAAREAIYQRLLINLSSAYATDAIIQYPVKIESPFNDPLTAPRISGKPLSLVYKTGLFDVISTIAGQYKVSAEYVANVIADSENILNKNAVVLYPAIAGKPRTGQQVSLQEIADSLGIPVDLLTLRGIAVYFDVNVEEIGANLQVVSGGGLFAPEVTINISSVRKRITAEDTLDTMAEFFDTNVGDVALANLYLVDIFIPGALTVDGQTVIVPAGNTLVSVAAEFQDIGPIELAYKVAGRTNLLNPATTMYGLQYVPDHSLSTAKTPLSNGGSAVTFLFNTKAEAQYKKLFLDLNYVVNELEFDIKGGLQGISDYQASSWLTFIIPIGQQPDPNIRIDTNIGQVETPIPLRSYPIPPSLVSQNGTSSVDDSKSDAAGEVTVEEAKLWDYAFVYERQDAAQDTDYLNVIINQLSSAGKQAKVGDAVDPFDALFNALAQFIAVYPQVKKDLEGLLSLKPGEKVPILENAIKTFSQLVMDVAVAGKALADACEAGQLRTALARRGLHEEVYNYSVNTIATESGERFLQALILTALDNQTELWPLIYVVLPDQEVELEMSPVGPNQMSYNYPDDERMGLLSIPRIPAYGPLKLRLVFKRFDIIERQNAWSGVFMTRNEKLVSTAKTNKAFVYKTPMVRFTNTMVPLIQYFRSIPINYAADLKQSLDILFDKLFRVENSTDTQNIKLGTQFGYELVGEIISATGPAKEGTILEPIRSLLPVLLLPQFQFELYPAGDEPPNNLVNRLTDAINFWQDNHGHPELNEGSFYIFDLSVFSSVDDELVKPLLQLKNLSYQIGLSEAK